MLVRITNSCRMGCTHCLVDARPDGEHMARETFEKVTSFVKSTGIPLMMVSGGEPADHPNIVGFLEHLKREGVTAALLSNGMFLTEDRVRRRRILDLVNTVQVTNDPRFYPKRISRETVGKYRDKGVVLETHIQKVRPFGRAIRNGLDIDESAGPMCFNLRSAVRSIPSFRTAITYLRISRWMCTPSIDVDGKLRAGESPSCSSFGSVEDGDETLTRALTDIRCNRCGLCSKLTPEFRAVIGESR